MSSEEKDLVLSEEKDLVLSEEKDLMSSEMMREIVKY